MRDTVALRVSVDVDVACGVTVRVTRRVSVAVVVGERVRSRDGVRVGVPPLALLLTLAVRCGVRDGDTVSVRDGRGDTVGVRVCDGVTACVTLTLPDTDAVRSGV